MASVLSGIESPAEQEWEFPISHCFRNGNSHPLNVLSTTIQYLYTAPARAHESSTTTKIRCYRRTISDNSTLRPSRSVFLDAWSRIFGIGEWKHPFAASGVARRLAGRRSVGCGIDPAMAQRARDRLAAILPFPVGDSA